MVALIRPSELLLLLALLVGCGGSTLREVAAGEVTVSEAATWPRYGATDGGTRFSPATQITPANVAQLEVAWQHRSGDIRQGRFNLDDMVSQSSHQTTPILLGDRLYYCSSFNKVFALDAETGEEIWAYDPEVARDEFLLPNCRGVSSWESGAEGFCQQRIFLGTLDGRLIALDADSGEPCSEFGDGGEVDTREGLGEFEPREYSITSPPAILGDRVITGSLVLDNQRVDAPAGVVRAYDANSGDLLWAWNPVPPGQPQQEAGVYTAATTNAWSILSVDVEQDMVFVPTGNTSVDYFGGWREGLDHYSSSVVALSGSSGEVLWHYQMVHHDLWDYDTPSQPTLVDLRIDGEVVPALIQLTKMGMTFALHRETGEPLWPVEERPVPQQDPVAGEYLSPTQPFPSHIPYTIDPVLSAEDAWGMIGFDRASCARRIEALRNEGIYTPPSLQGSLHYPNNVGGNNWGSPAIDPRSKVMVVYTSRVPGELKLLPREQCENSGQAQKGAPYCVETDFLRSPLGVPCTQPPWGTLDAIDLEAGELVWSVPLGTTRDMAPFPFWWIDGLPGFGAPMVTAGGLVFSGVSNEHAFRAFDLASGEELWKARLPTAANALPMSYQLRPGGRQYVVIAAGGHWTGGAPPGDYLIAYALKEEIQK